jgi:hypothetical protein
MPETLKDFFDRALVARMAAAVGSTHPPFPGEAFTRDAARGLDRLELMARARHIASSCFTS